MLISVVIPMYNEESGAKIFHETLLLPHLKRETSSYEVIYVNDGSKDNTLKVLQEIARTDKKVKLINLSRNFGKEIAITAGIAHATGNATITMDGDGQHPPASIHDFVAAWKKGAQVVIGIRETNQKEGLVKRWGSKVFYKTFNSLSGATIVPRSTDYRLMDAVVRTEFLKCSERQRITRGIIDWLGFRREFVIFHSPARLAGEASYSTRQLFRLALNSFVSLSLKPLLVLSWLGAFITLFSFCTGGLIVLEQYAFGDPWRLHFTGSALLGIFVSFLVGIVITSMGIVAIYLSHIYEQTQGRPLYVTDPTESINV